jgi:hypothetical protein
MNATKFDQMPLSGYTFLQYKDFTPYMCGANIGDRGGYKIRGRTRNAMCQVVPYPKTRVYSLTRDYVGDHSI